MGTSRPRRGVRVLLRDWRAAPAMGACTSRAGATAGSVRTSMAARHSISAGAASVRTASRSPWSAPTTLSSTSLVYSFDNPKAPTRRPVPSLDSWAIAPFTRMDGQHHTAEAAVDDERRGQS